MQVEKTYSSLGAMIVRELHLMYGKKFEDQWKGLTPRDLMDSWDQKISDMTEDEVRCGLVACLSKDWPPTLPEFLRLCRPWVDPEVAFYAAVAGMTARKQGKTGDWPHPAIYWAAVSIGAHDLMGATYQNLKTRWGRALSDEFAKPQTNPVPPPAEALPAPGQTMATKAEAEQAMRNMGAEGLLTESKTDHGRWLKKIKAELADPKGKRYSPTVMDMVRRAEQNLQGAR